MSKAIVHHIQSCNAMNATFHFVLNKDWQTHGLGHFCCPLVKKVYIFFIKTIGKDIF